MTTTRTRVIDLVRVSRSRKRSYCLKDFWDVDEKFLEFVSETEEPILIIVDSDGGKICVAIKYTDALRTRKSQGKETSFFVVRAVSAAAEMVLATADTLFLSDADVVERHGSAWCSSGNIGKSVYQFESHSLKHVHLFLDIEKQIYPEIGFDVGMSEKTSEFETVDFFNKESPSFQRLIRVPPEIKLGFPFEFMVEVIQKESAVYEIHFLFPIMTVDDLDSFFHGMCKLFQRGMVKCTLFCTNGVFCHRDLVESFANRLCCFGISIGLTSIGIPFLEFMFYMFQISPQFPPPDFEFRRAFAVDRVTFSRTLTDLQKYEDEIDEYMRKMGLDVLGRPFVYSSEGHKYPLDYDEIVLEETTEKDPETSYIPPLPLNIQSLLACYHHDHSSLSKISVIRRYKKTYRKIDSSIKLVSEK